MPNKNSFQSPELESKTVEALTKQLFEANRELQKVQKEREEMLSNISHDLRAPITAIRSALDYLNASPDLDREEIDRTLKLIDRRTTNLERLIQDMYYLFCIEDTSKEFDYAVVDAAPFLEEYFFDLETDSRYAGHHMVLDVPEDLPCRIRIDIQKMVRVLDNLFTNAAKYTPQGGTITLHAKASENPGELLISVIDSGKGIPAEAIPYIFNRTYTVSNSRTPNSATGSGLGLSIVKAIIQRFGGSVECKSTVDVGSEFQIILKTMEC